MKKFNKIVSSALIFASLSFPMVAKASSWCTVKLKVNNTSKNYQISTNKLKEKLNFSQKISFLIKNQDGKLILLPNISETKQKEDIHMDKEEIRDRREVKEQEYAKELTIDEKKMLSLINSERKKAGLSPLKVDMRLVSISRQKSKDMIDKNYFGHTSPTYGTPFEVLKKNGVNYRFAGENLAGAPDVVSAHNSLMKSPGHRANILNPNYNYVGIGIVDGGPYGKMYTQTFVGTK